MGAERVVVKTSVGGYTFDAYLSVQHDLEVTLTQNPVETGAAISDHAYVMPAKLTLQIGMSDAAQDLTGQFSGGSSRGVTAFTLLDQLHEARLPLEVVTRLKTYENMVVQSISVPDDHTTALGLKATVVLQQIFVATVQTVKISARPQTTGTTNKGTVQATQPSSSILYQWDQAIGGTGVIAP